MALKSPAKNICVIIKTILFNLQFVGGGGIFLFVKDHMIVLTVTKKKKSIVVVLFCFWKSEL